MKNNFQSGSLCMELTHDFYYLAAILYIKMPVGYVNMNFMNEERNLCMCRVFSIQVYNLVHLPLKARAKNYWFKVAF